MRLPPSYWARYRETEGVPGEVTAGPDPMQAAIEQYMLMNQGGEEVDTLHGLMDMIRKGPMPARELSPQEYIDMQFRQLEE